MALDFWPTVIGFPLISFAFGLMVLSAILPSSFLYKIRWKLSALIATLSYSIYLCHKFVNHMLQPALNQLNISAESSWRVFICAIVSILIALLLNRIVEYPFMKLKAAILKKQKKTEEPIVVA